MVKCLNIGKNIGKPIYRLISTFQHFSKKKKKCSLNKKGWGNAETLSPLTLLGAVAIKENVFRFIYMFNIIIYVFICLIYFGYEK